jgi:hypothetical protein
MIPVVPDAQRPPMVPPPQPPAADGAAPVKPGSVLRNADPASSRST